MRNHRAVLLAGAALWASPSVAAETLQYGPAPAWVVSHSIPAAKPTDAAVSFLLNDEQTALDGATITTFNELAIRIENPQGLSAGNISFAWDPGTETVTVNKLQIRRGDKIIDVLKSGQTFTVMRRETNLDAAILDGTLTANIQPEGLQEGDIIDLATTTEHRDPVLKGHVEANFGAWNEAPLESGYALLSWPAASKVNVRESAGLPPLQRSTRDGRTLVQVAASKMEPLILPKNAPTRFRMGRLGEATDYSSWSDVAQLMLPLYSKAAVVPASGPLRDELEKIRSASADPKTRATQALALVQDRVRYVALLMGQGGFVPATAEQTWSRRFGDCKAKTTLLLALLHELGIAAEPVLVNTEVGDAIADRLPMVGLFNHVLVRAHIGGRDYWLDGTRTGDTALDDIDVPDFGWGLPLVDKAALVHIVPPPLKTPQVETALDVDASHGAYAPAPAHAEQILRGDLAVGAQLAIAGLTDAQRQAFFQSYWSKKFDFITFKSGTAVFDKTKRELRLTMTGDAKLDWSDGYFHVPDSTVGYEADFARPAGPLQDAPLAVGYPGFTKSVTKLHLPPSFIVGRRLGSADVHETLAGEEYNRTARLDADVLTVETTARSVVPEISYKDALAAQAKLRALDDEDVSLPMPTNYRATIADLDALPQQEPGSTDDYQRRALTYLDAGKHAEALADLDKVLEKQPRNVTALGSRAIAYAATNDFAAAKKDIAAGQAIEPGNLYLLRARGVLAERQGDTEAAIADYTKCLEKEPADSYSRFRRAALYQNQWKYDAAIADLTEILTREPKNVGALSFRALVYAAKGDKAAADRDLAAAKAISPGEEAVTLAQAQLASRDRDSGNEIAAYSKLLETAPVKGPILTQRASAYFGLHRYDEALADTDQALKLGFHEVDLHLVRANIFMRRGDRAAVKAEAEAMTRDNPQSNFAFIAAGKTYQALGMHEEAMQALDKALAMHPDVMTYLNRADVRPYTDLEGRLSDVDAALKLEPNDVDALMQKAYNLVLKGDYAQALRLYDQSATIDVNPDNRAIPMGRAVALYKSGRQAEAEKVLASVRARAKSARDFQSLCWSEARWNMFVQTAVKDCEQAQKLDPKTPTDDQGLALLRAGRIDDAIASFGKSIAASRDAFSYMGRAIAYQRQGKLAQAAADRREALKLRPDEESILAEYGLKFDAPSGPEASQAATPAAN